MVEGLLLEARMRTRIAELREYRRHGIRTFADAEVGRQGGERQRCCQGAGCLVAVGRNGICTFADAEVGLKRDVLWAPLPYRPDGSKSTVRIVADC